VLFLKLLAWLKDKKISHLINIFPLSTHKYCIFDYSGENMVINDLDPLQSEPKPKRIKKSQDGYQCSQCDYVATRASNLKIHIEYKHEGVRYPCPQCEFAGTTASNLKNHIERKHEGVRYPCFQCEHVATRASDLKRHVESKHEGMRYPCSQCEHVATRASDLKRHVESKHLTFKHSC